MRGRAACREPLIGTRRLGLFGYRHSPITYARNATGPFYHGTRAELAPGDLLAPGFTSNYADRKLSWIYFSGTLDAAI